VAALLLPLACHGRDLTVVGAGTGRRSRPLAFAALLGAVLLGHGWLMHSPAWWRAASSPARPAVLTVRQIDLPTALPLAVESAPPVAVASVTAKAKPAMRAAAIKPQRVAPAPAASATAPVEEPPAPLPLYATRLAAPIEWAYRLQRGDQQGSATLVWQPDFEGARYEARLAGEIDGRGVLHWSSHGAIDAAGIAPERFVLREPRRGAQAANFERAARRITYSGPPVAHALPDGAQDRLSWLIQLAAVVAADPQRHGAAGGVVELFVAGARGDADRWRFDAQGVQSVELADGTSIQTWAYERAPLRSYDVRVQAWLAPALGWLPVRLRVSPTGAGRPLELLLAANP
jgi:hypothetical protein